MNPIAKNFKRFQLNDAILLLFFSSTQSARDMISTKCIDSMCIAIVKRKILWTWKPFIFCHFFSAADALNSLFNFLLDEIHITFFKLCRRGDGSKESIQLKIYEPKFPLLKYWFSSSRAHKAERRWERACIKGSKQFERGIFWPFQCLRNYVPSWTTRQCAAAKNIDRIHSLIKIINSHIFQGHSSKDARAKAARIFIAQSERKKDEIQYVEQVNVRTERKSF